MLRHLTPVLTADTEIDWQAYMEQVQGFLAVSPLILAALSARLRTDGVWERDGGCGAG